MTPSTKLTTTIILVLIISCIAESNKRDCYRACDRRYGGICIRQYGQVSCANSRRRCKQRCGPSLIFPNDQDLDEEEILDNFGSIDFAEQFN